MLFYYLFVGAQNLYIIFYNNYSSINFRVE